MDPSDPSCWTILPSVARYMLTSTLPAEFARDGVCFVRFADEDRRNAIIQTSFMNQANSAALHAVVFLNNTEIVTEIDSGRARREDEGDEDEDDDDGMYNTSPAIAAGTGVVTRKRATGSSTTGPSTRSTRASSSAVSSAAADDYVPSSSSSRKRGRTMASHSGQIHAQSDADEYEVFDLKMLVRFLFLFINPRVYKKKNNNNNALLSIGSSG